MCTVCQWIYASSTKEVPYHPLTEPAVHNSENPFGCRQSALPMLIDFIFLLILFGLVYSYTSSQNQFAATASAIRQIWSGSCRWSCRHSEHSGLSGLSGLPARPSADNGAGPSRDCHCEACPCALIDNFLSSWRPATTMYSQLIELLSDLITYVLQLLMDTYEYFVRVVQCNTTCNRPQTIVYKPSHGSNSSFGKGDKENVEKVKSATSGKIGEEVTKNKNSNTEKGDVVKKGKLSDVNNDVGTSKGAVPPGGSVPSTGKMPKDKLEAVVKPSKTADLPMKMDSSSASLARNGYCSKCIEKGRTCIKECPRAKK